MTETEAKVIAIVAFVIGAGMGYLANELIQSIGQIESIKRGQK